MKRSKMMKNLILVRANKTKFGGAENYLQRLSKELQNKGIKHKTLYSSIPKFFASWIRAFFFNLQVCKRKTKDDFYFSLERITCPDIYRAGDGVHKEFLKTKKRKFNPLNIVYLYLEKRCFVNAKKIIANSKMIKNQIIDTYNINPSKIDVIYNGIELKEFDYETSFIKLSKEFRIDSKKKIILYVGSGFERKGVAQFLQILSELKSTNYQAFIVGKEKNLKFYQELAQSLHVKEKVCFTGARSDVDDFYTISDIFLFPTQYEPFSNVILEAMNFKNAVITTKQNGAHEILNKNFIMKTPIDLSIVQKIDNLLIDNKKLEKIKEENYQIVQNFTIEKNAKETMKVINEYLY